MGELVTAVNRRLVRGQLGMEQEGRQALYNVILSF